MSDFGDWAVRTFNLSDDAERRIILSVGILVGLTLLRWMMLVIIRRRLPDPRDHYRWGKGTSYAAVILGLVLLSRVWLVDFGAFATYLGLLSAGLAIALKDPLANLAGWLFILWRRPFVVGDRIEIATHAGDVVDVRLFQFTLLEVGHWVHADQTTGRLIHLPNALLFTVPLMNFTSGFHSIWTELPVLVTFESDWKRAETILREIIQRHGARAAEEAGSQVAEAARRYALAPGATAPDVYLSVEESGVQLTMRTPCDARRRREVTQAIWRDVLDAFAACPDIDFAYPTTRMYRNSEEGKPALQPPGTG